MTPGRRAAVSLLALQLAGGPGISSADDSSPVTVAESGGDYR